MGIRITSNELNRLNDLVKLYYGDEINIYVMHGLMVSYLCSARTENFEHFLFDFDNQEPIIPMLEFEGNIDKEFLPLLLGKMFNRTVEISNKAQLVYPLVTTNAFNGKFNYNNLSIEEQKNLLDWYMGFFQGFMYIWNHDAIGKYIVEPDKENELLNGLINEQFVTALNTHYFIANNLISEIKPNYKNNDFRYSIEEIKKSVKAFTDMQLMLAQSLLKNTAYYLQACSEMIRIGYSARKFMLSNASPTSANDATYTKN